MCCIRGICILAPGANVSAKSDFSSCENYYGCARAGLDLVNDPTSKKSTYWKFYKQNPFFCLNKVSHC